MRENFEHTSLFVPARRRPSVLTIGSPFVMQARETAPRSLTDLEKFFAVADLLVAGPSEFCRLPNFLTVLPQVIEFTSL